MPPQDTTDIRDKIVFSIKEKGPTIPVFIAKEIGLSILFTSAFLSELLSEKRLKMSHMRIGSSPLYFVEGQEPMLEKFSHHLQSKEKEAFTILKEKKFMKDAEQQPAIRVALREIKDFAVPFKKDEELIWRFFTVPETEFIEKIEKEKPIVKAETLPIEVMPSLEEVKEKVDLPVMEKISSSIVIEKIKEIKKDREKKKPKVKTTTIKKRGSSTAKHDEKFLERVKEFLSKNSIEIINIEGLKKDELLLKVKVNGIEQLLAAYKKNKISEVEIIKTAKKASEMNLKYSLLSMGELPKKISDLIGALQNINDIKKVG